jgi:hypothetical protein
MTPDPWFRKLVPPVPDLPEDLTVPLPVPVPRPKVSRPRTGPVLALADAPVLARKWFSDGASLLLIAARLNQRCPRELPWTRPAVRRLLIRAPRLKAA